MKSEFEQFVHCLDDSNLTEVELSARIAWFLHEAFESKKTTISDVVKFLKDTGLRSNVNMTRLRKNLRGQRGISISSDGVISLSLALSRDFDGKYSDFLTAKPAEIDDVLLIASDFQSRRKYVKELVRQINGSYQFAFFDACATMMRRLVEVLIIDGYIEKQSDHLIRDTSNNLLMMNGLIGALKSGQTFKLSRNAPGWLEKVKTLGDTAAHSRTYLTKQKDIDEFSHEYRMLVEEISSFSH